MPFYYGHEFARGDIITADTLNKSVRDNLNFLYALRDYTPVSVSRSGSSQIYTAENLGFQAGHIRRVVRGANRYWLDTARFAFRGGYLRIRSGIDDYQAGANTSGHLRNDLTERTFTTTAAETMTSTDVYNIQGLTNGMLVSTPQEVRTTYLTVSWQRAASQDGVDIRGDRRFTNRLIAQITGLRPDINLDGDDTLLLPPGSYTISLYAITGIYDYRWVDTPRTTTPAKTDWNWRIEEALF